MLQRNMDAANLAHSVPFEVDLRKPQDAYYHMLTHVFPEMEARAEGSDAKAAKAKEWATTFLRLGEQLGFEVEQKRRTAVT